MSAAESVPFELRAINVEAVAELLGLAPRTVLENVACLPDFPARVSIRPASWVAGEVLAWRDAQRNKIRRHPRRSARSSAVTS